MQLCHVHLWFASKARGLRVCVMMSGKPLMPMVASYLVKASIALAQNIAS